MHEPVGTFEAISSSIPVAHATVDLGPTGVIYLGLASTVRNTMDPFLKPSNWTSVDLPGCL